MTVGKATPAITAGTGTTGGGTNGENGGSGRSAVRGRTTGGGIGAIGRITTVTPVMVAEASGSIFRVSRGESLWQFERIRHLRGCHREPCVDVCRSCQRTVSRTSSAPVFKLNFCLI